MRLRRCAHSNGAYRDDNACLHCFTCLSVFDSTDFRCSVIAKSLAAGILALLASTGFSTATPLVVTTPSPGFDLGQCVQTDGASSIEQAPCTGRTQVLTGVTALTADQCGSHVTGNIADVKVTLPDPPPPNCMFTFSPSDFRYYLDLGNQVAHLPGYANVDVVLFTIPPSRNPNNYYTVQFNGSYWTEAGASPLLHETFNPDDDGQLAHGQVYFRWNATASQFELVQQNGPGGLIVDGAITQVPTVGVWLKSRSTSITSNARNFFYLKRPDSNHVPTVLGAVGTTGGTSGLVELTLSTMNGADTGDQILLKCHSVLGTFEANGIWTGTVVDSTRVDLIGSSFSHAFTPSPKSQCVTWQLVASTTGHITQNGVEIKSDDVHATLVGMCYVGSSNSVSDTSTKRDCASWYNRGLKTCMNKFTADRTVSSTSYTEVNSEIECEFVTWGAGDPVVQTDLSWSISGMIKNGTAGDGAAVTARFDAMTPVEAEEIAVLNPTTVIGGFPLAAKGSKTGLSEGKHYITLVAKVLTGGTATLFGTTRVTTVEVAIPQ